MMWLSCPVIVAFIISPFVVVSDWVLACMWGLIFISCLARDPAPCVKRKIENMNIYQHIISAYSNENMTLAQGEPNMFPYCNEMNS